jgi:uncharacterized protein YutE (UPF0331/DUF86 family)
MVDVAMILERLKRLAEYLAFLEQHKSLAYEEFVKDKTIEFSVERVLQLAIQIVVDIATHILATASNVTPEDYTDAIIKLAEVGVIPAAYAVKIMAMPKFRNILVHEYVNIDPRLVYENMQEELNDFVLFARYINEWLNKQGLLKPPDSQS